jgi:hypothetical protein
VPPPTTTTTTTVPPPTTTTTTTVPPPQPTIRDASYAASATTGVYDSVKPPQTKRQRLTRGPSPIPVPPLPVPHRPHVPIPHAPGWCPAANAGPGPLESQVMAIRHDQHQMRLVMNAVATETNSMWHSCSSLYQYMGILKAMLQSIRDDVKDIKDRL